ncbi:CotO family spore coat protein [Bacillus infantis]|uniref:CotO family spore coat protein n=1 Tax=Bacillus infantis TaxID=324767 RepID=UPI003CEF927B
MNSGKNKGNPTEQSQHFADENNEEKENTAGNRLSVFTEQDIFMDADGVPTRISSDQSVADEYSSLPQSFYNPAGKWREEPNGISTEKVIPKDEEKAEEAEIGIDKSDHIPEEKDQRKTEGQQYVNSPKASEAKIPSSELQEDKACTVTEKDTSKKIKPFSKMSLIEKLEYLTSPPYYLRRMFVEINTKDRLYIGYVRSYSIDESSITLANMNTFKYYSIEIDEVINIKIIGL